MTVAERPPCDVAGVFTGPFAELAGRLVVEDAPGSIAVRDLADRAVFDELLRRFGRDMPDADRPALASFWSQYYFGALVIPATVLILMTKTAPSLGFDETRVSFCLDRGVPLRFHMADRPAAGFEGAAVAELGRVFSSHLAPLITHLSRHSGLAPKLFWENAGWYFVWTLGEVAHVRPEIASLLDDIVQSPHWPLPARTSLGHLHRTACSSAGIGRCVCCLRYRLPGLPHCAAICPLLRPRGLSTNRALCGQERPQALPNDRRDDLH